MKQRTYACNAATATNPQKLAAFLSSFPSTHKLISISGLMDDVSLGLRITFESDSFNEGDDAKGCGMVKNVVGGSFLIIDDLGPHSVYYTPKYTVGV